MEATSQKSIIRDLGVFPVINPAQEVKTRVAFLKEGIRQSNKKGLVLGISGGQDSTLAGRLAQIAVEELRTEGYDATFLAIRLPYGTQADESDAQMALDFIAPDASAVFNIKDTVDAFAATYNAVEEGVTLSDYDKGNVKARVRMTTQYAYASARGMLVVGTDHAAEAVSGFFTKFGDGGADILPLSGLNKRQGKELLKYLAAPKRLYEKAPTADLLDGKPGQEDETELGVTYAVLDDFLEGKEVDEATYKLIVDRYIATAHKRQQPYAFTQFF